MKMLNNNIEEDYVSFKLAQKLVRKGFTQIPTVGTFAILFNDNGDPVTYENYTHKNSGLQDGFIPRPTLQMAIKWIWINFHYHIEIPHIIGVYYWEINQTNIKNYIPMEANDNFKTPVEAMEDAINYALTKLIK